MPSPDRRSFVVKEHPHSWRDNFILAVGALIEIGKALHRIADALDSRHSPEEDTDARS